MFLIFLGYFYLNFFSDTFANNDNWKTEPATAKQQLKSRAAEKFIVSTASKFATNAAVEIIKKGGNAVDATIAAQMVLNLVEPYSSGIGGGGFLLYYNKKTGTSEYFNGRETAPSQSFSSMLLDKNGKEIEFEKLIQGGLSVATPGILKMLETAHNKYGKLPWKDLFEPAINLAETGFPLSLRLHKMLNHIEYLQNFPESLSIYKSNKNDPASDILPVGSIIKNQKLAETFVKIAENGSKEFYFGKTAKEVVKAVNNSKINPGILSLQDLSSYNVRQGDLICGQYRKKYKICSMPPPSSGGVTLLQILGILDNFSFAKANILDYKNIHIIAEATKIAYADRDKYIADTDNIPLKLMLSKEYLKKRANEISIKRANNNVIFGDFSKEKKQSRATSSTIAVDKNHQEPASTTHLSIIDADGNAVSLTSSIEYYFGSALSVNGFFLNNHMTDFSRFPEVSGVNVANSISPNKQPRSSMTPTFIFNNENDKLIAVIGSPGGPRIIQFVAKVVIGLIDFNLDIQDIANLPNFIALNNVIELESGTYITKKANQLKKIGHKTEIKDITSGINAVVDYENLQESRKPYKVSIKKEHNNYKNQKQYYGATDPRREGLVAGK